MHLDGLQLEWTVRCRHGQSSRCPLHPLSAMTLMIQQEPESVVGCVVGCVTICLNPLISNNYLDDYCEVMW